MLKSIFYRCAMSKITTFELADHVLGIIVDQEVDRELIEVIHKEIDLRLEKFSRISFFMELAEGHKVSLSALQKDLFYKISHSRKFDKIAMVSDSDRVKLCMELKKVFMDAEVRDFPLKDRMNAIEWISQ